MLSYVISTIVFIFTCYFFIQAVRYRKQILERRFVDIVKEIYDPNSLQNRFDKAMTRTMVSFVIFIISLFLIMTD